MEKINSSQIRIVITSQDLQEWKLSVREMKYGSRETTELFRQMLQKAAQQFSFNQEGLRAGGASSDYFGCRGRGGTGSAFCFFLTAESRTSGLFRGADAELPF